MVHCRSMSGKFQSWYQTLAEAPATLPCLPITVMKKKKESPSLLTYFRMEDPIPPADYGP